MYIYIYIYIERERDIDKQIDTDRPYVADLHFRKYYTDVCKMLRTCISTSTNRTRELAKYVVGGYFLQGGAVGGGCSGWG